jgi:hypothetical protein
MVSRTASPAVGQVQIDVPDSLISFSRLWVKTEGNEHIAALYDAWWQVYHSLHPAARDSKPVTYQSLLVSLPITSRAQVNRTRPHTAYINQTFRYVSCCIVCLLGINSRTLGCDHTLLVDPPTFPSDIDYTLPIMALEPFHRLLGSRSVRPTLVLRIRRSG